MITLPQAYALRLLAIFTFCFLTAAHTAFAATYYVNATGGNDSNDGLTTGTAWKTLDKVSSSTFQGGDIIDGMGTVFTGRYDAGGNIINRLVVPSSGSADDGYITFRNFTIDGSVSIDGSLTFYAANTYSDTQPWSGYGAGDVTGEVYKKTMTRPPYQMFEDGVKLTPIVSATATDALALARGQFTWNNNRLYYRASDGADPAAHALRASRRDTDGLTGLIYSHEKNYLRFEEITLKNNDNNTLSPHALYLSSGDNISVHNVNIYNNGVGLGLMQLTNATVSSTTVQDNVLSGISISGTSSNISISGSRVEGNGRPAFYNGGSLGTYPGDSDGIGIGGGGGTMTEITIEDSEIVNNGPPDGTTFARGTGIYVGTSEPFSIGDLRILRSKIAGNHYGGIISGTITDGFHGRTVLMHNVLYDNGNLNSTSTSGVGISIGTYQRPCDDVSIANNVLAFHYTRATTYLNNDTAATSCEIIDNILYNNGRESAYRADVWIQENENNITESHNHYYRSGTAWDSANVIEKTGLGTYDINEVIGTSAGTWQYDSGQGQDNRVNAADFVDPTAFNFSLRHDSPAIDAGTTTALHTATSTDFFGNPIYGTPDIGAIEYQPPYVIGNHDVPATGAIRLYADGKFRERIASTTASTSDLAVAPQGGWGSANYRAYMDLEIDSWTASSMAWTATSSIATTTVFTMGGLIPNGWYNVQLDAATSSSISGTACTSSVCQANGSGVLAFTYSGSWSTHSFEVTPGSNPTPLPTAALNPSPADGATTVSTSTIMSWTAGSGATSHAVYFGTDSSPDASQLIGVQGGTSYDPGPLSASTTYWWRIDEANAQGTTTGPLWSFTTVAATAPGSLPDPATSPAPTSGTADVSTSQTLSWTAGSGATSHAVYFGTDSSPDDTEYKGNQAGTTYDPSPLSRSATYWWRIDEVNSTGTTTGTVWSFTTARSSSGGKCRNCVRGFSESAPSSTDFVDPVDQSGATITPSTGTPFRCAETGPVTDGLSGAGLVNLLVSLGIIPATKAKAACDALLAKTAETPSTAGVTSFSQPLRLGARGAEVTRLQVFLNARGFTIAESGPGSRGNETDLFGLLTEGAVKRFQAAYATEILAPVDLTAPSGFWGASSMRKANALLSQ